MELPVITIINELENTGCCIVSTKTMQSLAVIELIEKYKIETIEKQHSRYHFPFIILRKENVIFDKQDKETYQAQYEELLKSNQSSRKNIKNLYQTKEDLESYKRSLRYLIQSEE